MRIRIQGFSRDWAGEKDHPYEITVDTDEHDESWTAWTNPGNVTVVNVQVNPR